MLTLRGATTADVPRLVEMGQRFRRESPYASRLPDNPAQLAKLGQQLIDQPGGLLLVGEIDGVVVGMIGVFLYEHHMAGWLTAGEVFFWMEPEHRGYGGRLLKRAEAWATAQGARTMQLIAPHPSGIGRWYERHGYATIEVAYEKVLTKGDPT